MVGGQQVAALGPGNGGQVVLPMVREHPACTVLVEQVDLPFPAQEDSPQHQGRHSFREGLGVGQCQGRAPGTAEHQPAIYAQMLADALHVRDQGLGAVVLQLGMRSGAPTSALIEQNNPVAPGIEKAPMIGLATRTGATVQKHGRNTIGGPALLQIQLMGRLHRQTLSMERSDLGIQIAHDNRLTQGFNDA